MLKPSRAVDMILQVEGTSNTVLGSSSAIAIKCWEVNLGAWWGVEYKEDTPNLWFVKR